MGHAVTALSKLCADGTDLHLPCIPILRFEGEFVSMIDELQLQFKFEFVGVSWGGAGTPGLTWCDMPVGQAKETTLRPSAPGANARRRQTAAKIGKDLERPRLVMIILQLGGA